MFTKSPTYLKILTARTQDKSVNFDELSLCSQNHIHQCLPFQQRIKDRHQHIMMIVPSQTKLLNFANHY